MQPAKTVAALHDLSGFGRCALTIAIPVISAMGVQVVPAPTAVLSAHTAFPDFVSMDLTKYLDQCLSKWNSMGLQFDCVYTGYMASIRQEEIARRFMDAQPQALKIIDPVMGDDGVMYRALPGDMPDAMRRLCRYADVITPNLTEAALLTGEPCALHPIGTLGTGSRGREWSASQLETLLEKLLALGPKTALLTGVPVDGAHANVWMSVDGKIHFCPYQPLPASFPGTGDLFASVLTGALTRGQAFESAVQLATDYVRETMLVTLECGTSPLHGVQLEKTLSKLSPPEKASPGRKPPPRWRSVQLPPLGESRESQVLWLGFQGTASPGVPPTKSPILPPNASRHHGGAASNSPRWESPENLRFSGWGSRGQRPLAFPPHIES